MSFNISSGVTAKAQKVVLYGVEGIGKSTFASQFPMPLYIDTEGSTTNMNVNRLPKPTSWQMILEEIAYVKQNQLCETLIIDTADWAETLANEAICARNGVKSIEDLGYGKGYTMAKEEFGKFLNQLSDLTEFGINVVVTAHADLKKKEEPDQMGAYDRYQLKLSKQCAPLLKEWADMLLFANYETTIVTDSKTQSKKATGGRRVMHTTHHPAWDAKNRHNLPEELPFDFSSIAHIFQKAPVTQLQSPQPVIEPVQENLTGFDQAMAQTDPKFQRELLPIDPSIDASLYQLMEANGVTEVEIQKLVAKKGWMPFETLVKDYPADLVQGALVAQWPTALKEIEANRIF